ncbi:putative reverse transcriptase domain-containing protein [Tanacetum coccineum]
MAPKRRTTRLNPSATPTPVTDTHTTTSVTNAQIQAMINEGVTAALAARDATRNGDDSHTSGTGVRRPVQVARECTYPDFLKCQPLNFKGTEGVVGLTQWFEKMESVYSISNCTVACQVKFATCTLQGNALTWWNSHVKTTTPEAAHAMPWRTLKKMMTDKYCPRGEIKKLEFEMWNLKVKGNDVVTYSQHFQELALMCDRMFPEEIDQVEKYVGGLPDTIHGSVMATKPKTMQDAIESSTETHGQEDQHFGERQADNKRKTEDTARNNRSTTKQDTKTLKSLCHMEWAEKQGSAKVVRRGQCRGKPDNNVVTVIMVNWLAKYHAVIVCAEKIVRIPFGDEILIVRGDGSSNKHGTRLNIISCTKAQEYLTEGISRIILANNTAIPPPKTKTSPKEKRHERCAKLFKNFPKTFLGLAGYPPTRQAGVFESIGTNGATPVQGTI